MQTTPGMVTPKQAGFRMPAEWERHERSWMMWPARADFWDDIAATKRDYAAVAHAICEFEPVTMAVRPQDAAEARAMLGGDIKLAITEIDDSWARDAGPCFVVNDRGACAGVNFRFNAWGGKYHPHDKDDAFASYVLDQANAQRFNSRLVAKAAAYPSTVKALFSPRRAAFPTPTAIRTGRETKSSAS